MGGIVARWRKKENGKDEEDKLGSKRNINGEVNENNAKEIEEELPNSESGKTVAEKLNDEVESREGDKDQLTSSQNKNLVKLENIVEPEKPPDLIFELDLYPEPPIILKQIRSHLQESDSVSEEVQKIFLTHPEKSFASKTKLKTQKSIFQPDVHLKELTNKWLLPFRIHLSSFPIPIVFLDVHFRQLTSFKVLVFLTFRPQT